MNTEFQRNLETLQKKDPHYLGENWKKSASYFKEEARSGKDISSAVNALKNVFYESQQVPVMDEVSAALIYQSLNLSDFGELNDLVQNTAYPDFIFSVFLNISEKKEGMESAAPFLLSCYAEHKKAALPVLRKIIGKSREKEKLISKAAAFLLHRKKALLPEFLRSLAADKISIDSVLYHLNSFFVSEKETALLAEYLPGIAESGADLSPIEENVLILLKKGKKNIRRIYSMCISVHYICSGQKEKLEGMISDRSSDIRYGSCSSIIFSFYKNSYKIVDLEKILLFLSDPEEEIRTLALNRLRIIERENPETLPDEDFIKEHILSQPKISSALFEYLCIYSEKNVKNAQFILDLSFGLDHPDKGRLTESCLQKISGHETCRICLAIPRRKLYYWDFEVPKEILKLVPEMDFTEETTGCRRVCPVCGRKYHYRFITEYEDMSSSTEIRIEKLGPELPETPEDSENLEMFLGILRRELHHLDAQVRENAAFDLSVYYYLVHDHKNLCSLLGSDEEQSLQKGAMQGISDREYSEELVSAVAGLLNSPNSRIRANASGELARHYMQTDNIHSLRNILLNEDQTYTVSPAVQKAYFLSREKKINLDILYPVFLNLLNSSDETVRRFSDYFLAEMNHPEGSAQKMILERLSHRNPEIRKEAALSLERKTSKDFDPSFAFRSLLRLLKNKTAAWAAVYVFKKAAALNYDLKTVIPFLIRQIRNEKNGGREDSVWTLSIIEEKRGFPEEFLKSLSPLLAFREDNISYMAYNIFESAENKGKDISFAEKHIRKFFQSRKESDYLKERSVYLLTDICIQEKDSSKMKTLLLHRSSAVRYAASSRIYDSMRKGKDISFCRELIRQNIDHDYAFLKEVSQKILS